MDKDTIYKALADRFVNYQNLTRIPIIECHEMMEDASNFGVVIDIASSKLEASTGNKLILRKSVCLKLVEAQSLLNQLKDGYTLALTYAYRSMAIQKLNFEKMKNELGLDGRDDPEAMERVHHFIAVPEVAGHPTGGAVDVMIYDANNNKLDFGTPMHGLEKDSYAFCPFISDEATINRKLLRRIMQSVGFAPYDGEWWHFSYGDREWAAYYNQPEAIYGQLEWRE